MRTVPSGGSLAFSFFSVRKMGDCRPTGLYRRTGLCPPPPEGPGDRASRAWRPCTTGLATVHLVACAGPLFAAFEMRALLAGTLVSSPPATHLSWHVRGRSLGHPRCARSLRGRSFLRLLRPTSRGMCGAGRWGIRDERAPCGDARFFASCDPPLVACAGPVVSSPLATHLSWHVRGRSLGHSRCARSLRGRSFAPSSRGRTWWIPLATGALPNSLCGVPSRM